jgi:hypothetical protein
LFRSNLTSLLDLFVQTPTLDVSSIPRLAAVQTLGPPASWFTFVFSYNKSIIDYLKLEWKSYTERELNWLIMRHLIVDELAGPFSLYFEACPFYT